MKIVGNSPKLSKIDSSKVFTKIAATGSLAILSLLAGCTTTQVTVAQVTAVGTTNTAAKPVAAPQPGITHRAVLSGGSQALGYYYSMNPDCTMEPRATLRITQAPAHGTITFEQMETYPSYPKENQRYECNKQKITATAVMYKSNAGYTGDDFVKIDAVFSTGNFRTDTYSVAVK